MTAAPVPIRCIRSAQLKARGLDRCGNLGHGQDPPMYVPDVEHRKPSDGCNRSALWSHGSSPNQKPALLSQPLRPSHSRSNAPRLISGESEGGHLPAFFISASSCLQNSITPYTGVVEEFLNQSSACEVESA